MDGPEAVMLEGLSLRISDKKYVCGHNEHQKNMVRNTLNLNSKEL